MDAFESTGHIDIDALMERMGERSRIKTAVLNNADNNYRWGYIRQAYKMQHEHIMSAGKRSVCPYFIDWITLLTPIEFGAWQTIRAIGIALYPQYPVGKYFIDFANPFLKIGLECDGKQWHDEDKDRIRDTELINQGWKIFRLKGSECFKCPREIWEIEEEQREYGSDLSEEIKDRYFNTSVGLIEAINVYYFHEYHEHEYIKYIAQTLCRHMLIDFDLD